MKALAAGLFAALLGTAAYAGEAVNYKVDGAGYEGYFAKADGASKGLVLIVHDWDGLTGYEQKRADMLAKLGYDAFAADLFGNGNRPESVPARQAETGKLDKDRAKMRSLVLAALAEAQKKGGLEDVGNTHLLRGIALYNSGDAREARKSFNRALNFKKYAKSARQWIRVLDTRSSAE